MRRRSTWQGHVIHAVMLSPSPCCPFSFRVGISAALALGAKHLWHVEEWLHEDVHILGPKAHEYVTLRGKRNFADMIMLKVWGLEDYPGLSEWG